MKYMTTRTEQQQYEKQRLARYAIASADSRGRKYNEPEHNLRTCFARDRDRIIHCAAFRRLEAKTQVLVNLPGQPGQPAQPGSSALDYYRTRLTHTIEVSQIARSMARVLAVNEDLAEATSLAHDLGHPPYGHCGEAVLNELMANHGGFEHNQHSLRIVEYLEHPYPDFRGLNLTYETRLCLARHETRYDHPADNDEYGKGFAPLEGQIADLADSIAYNSHDLDDALVCGIISETNLKNIQFYQHIKSQMQEVFPNAHRIALQLRTAKSLIDILVRDALEETSRRLAKLKPQNHQQICDASQKMVALSPAMAEQLAELQDFLMENVYEHPRIANAKKIAATQLRFLFNSYLDNPGLLPPRYQDRIRQHGTHRIICDYIAGMTDRYCFEIYKKLSSRS